MSNLHLVHHVAPPKGTLITDNYMNFLNRRIAMECGTKAYAEKAPLGIDLFFALAEHDYFADMPMPVRVVTNMESTHEERLAEFVRVFVRLP